MDGSLGIPRPDTPIPSDIMEINLRTPSFIYNHGGYYAPADPKDCNTPGGPCSYCQDRIDELSAAKALVTISISCCADRPDFMEPCPSCTMRAPRVTHADAGLRCCNGCEETLCSNCYTGARYFCPLRRIEFLTPPPGPLVRQEALGVQSPKAEEKGENK
jgi:hypothetical protein